MLGFKKPNRYEYRIETSNNPVVQENQNFDTTQENLNTLGEAQWELIGVIPDMRNMSYIYYFKRTK